MAAWTAVVMVRQTGQRRAATAQASLALGSAEKLPGHQEELAFSYPWGIQGPSCLTSPPKLPQGLLHHDHLHPQLEKPRGHSQTLKPEGSKGLAPGRGMKRRVKARQDQGRERLWRPRVHQPKEAIPQPALCPPWLLPAGCRGEAQLHFASVQRKRLPSQQFESIFFRTVMGDKCGSD